MEKIETNSLYIFLRFIKFIKKQSKEKIPNTTVNFQNFSSIVLSKKKKEEKIQDYTNLVIDRCRDLCKIDDIFGVYEKVTSAMSHNLSVNFR